MSIQNKILSYLSTATGKSHWSSPDWYLLEFQKTIDTRESERCSKFRAWSNPPLEVCFTVFLP